MGVLDRLILRDDQWERISAHIIGDERTRGSSGHDNRMFVEAVLWIVRTGSPWRDLPERYGPWQTAHRRLTRWRADGTWETRNGSGSLTIVEVGGGRVKGTFSFTLYKDGKAGADSLKVTDGTFNSLY